MLHYENLRGGTVAGILRRDRKREGKAMFAGTGSLKEAEQQKGYTGYRYSKVGNDIFVTKLICNNEFISPIGFCNIIPTDFFTTDCIVEEIRNADTNKQYRWIKGTAFQSRRYEIGQKIKGESIYYCKTRSGLCLNYLYKNSVTGKIEDRNTGGFMFRGEIMPGLTACALSMLRSFDTKEECFYALSKLLLTAEKKQFSDEQRTLEEILHTDLLTMENVPKEAKPYPDCESMEECKEYWKDKNTFYIKNILSKLFKDEQIPEGLLI